MVLLDLTWCSGLVQFRYVTSMSQKYAMPSFHCYTFQYSNAFFIPGFHTTVFFQFIQLILLWTYEIHEFWYKQVNLDFSSESDMIRKFRAGLALQPVGTIFFHLKYLLFLLIFSNFLLNQIATAIFANSPFTEGKPNGYLSMRRLLLTPCSSCTMFNLTWPMWIHFQ